MNRLLPTLAMLSCFMTSAVLTSGSAQSPEEAKILEVQRRQAEAWNDHDAAAYARLFTRDGDVVNVVGWWWKGRPEIERKLQEAFAFVFRDSKLAINEVKVRFLTPTIALAHVRWSMTGARTPPGVPEPREGIQTQVLQKQGGRWLIAGFQNTNSVPERPFPREPEASGARTEGAPALRIHHAGSAGAGCRSGDPGGNDRRVGGSGRRRVDPGGGTLSQVYSLSMKKALGVSEGRFFSREVHRYCFIQVGRRSRVTSVISCWTTSP